MSLGNECAISFKVIHLSNATGEAGPTSNTLSNKAMPKDKFFVLELVCLMWLCGVGEKDVLCLCNSRSGSRALCGIMTSIHQFAHPLFKNLMIITLKHVGCPWTTVSNFPQQD
eukprot:scaffold7223_cov180-Ochromonas_danica.AAC.1